jgi:hypothetical protein
MDSSIGSVEADSMKKEREIEQFQSGHKAQLQQKIEKQIKRIEGIIEELLEGVAIGELTSKDRLMMAARFSRLYHHAIAIDNSLEANQEEDRENIGIDIVMKRMRGEKSKDKLHVIEATIAPYWESEGDGHDD